MLNLYAAHIDTRLQCGRRERKEAREAARAKEAAAEAELREAHSQAAELRSKSRPVEDYLAADKGAGLTAARDSVAAAQRRLQAAEDAARVRAACPAPLRRW